MRRRVRVPMRVVLIMVLPSSRVVRIAIIPSCVAGLVDSVFRGRRQICNDSSPAISNVFLGLRESLSLTLPQPRQRGR